MPKYQLFNNKNVLEPGSYTEIKGGDEVAPAAISSGKVLIIDTGSGAGYGGGSGALGTKFQGKKSIYSFKKSDEFRDFIAGGNLWDIADRIFSPSKDKQVNGCEELMLIQAKETTPGTLFLSFTNGYIELASYREGLGANGVTNNLGTLIKGLGMRFMSAGTGKYAMTFYLGQYKGKDYNNEDINGETITSALPKTIIKTDPFTKIGDLVNWMNKNADFAELFYVKSSQVNPAFSAAISAPATVNNQIYNGTLEIGEYNYQITALTANGETTPVTIPTIETTVANSGIYLSWAPVPYATSYRIYKDGEYIQTNSNALFDNGGLTWTTGTPPVSNTATYITDASGAFTEADLTNNTGLKLFSGATEQYTTAALDEAIEAIQEVDNTYFLCDKFGVTAGIDVENTKLFNAVLNEGIYNKFLVIGGGKDRTQFNQGSDSTFAMTAYYNSAYVYVVHGDILEKRKNAAGFRRLNTLYAAATIVGRLSGNAPQDPITWKDLNIDGVEHELKLQERNDALKAGVIHFRDIGGQYMVNQEVNSLQINDDIIYPVGSSPEGSIMRISALLNKEIKLRTEKRFVGSNYAKSDPADVKSYIEDILIEKTAKQNEDNLIISYKGINVSIVGADYRVQYGFVVNGPINRLFITGFMFSPNSSI